MPPAQIPLHSQPPSSGSTQPAPGHSLPQFHGAHILVVDDDQDARELLEYLLTASGASAETASSADEAMKTLVAGQFELLIADIGMPERDGYSLLADVRTHRDARIRDIGVIASTAFAAGAEREKALAAGFDEFVPKPIDPDRLMKAVASLLSRKASG